MFRTSHFISCKDYLHESWQKSKTWVQMWNVGFRVHSWKVAEKELLLYQNHEMLIKQKGLQSILKFGKAKDAVYNT